MSEIYSEPQVEPLMGHVRELSRRVKLSGTAEELESFRYIKAKMESYGFRTKLIEHDAYISLPGKALITVDNSALQCITHSMSMPTPEDGIAAQLMYVGEGKRGDFASTEVKGKIVLVDGIAAEDIAAFASAAGAIGQIHISPNTHLYEMCVSPVWGSPSQHTRSQLPGTVVCTVANLEGSYLRARCQQGEHVTVSMRADVETGWRKTPLLVAELGPNSPNEADQFVLLSGHHDTWHYGVMDNGTANATMLEVARLLATERAYWRRGLRICFWSGHSHGRYSGSAWYADEHWCDLEQHCAAHVNVDSTGGKDATLLTNSGVVDELKAVAFKAVQAVSGQKHAGCRQGRGGDQSFWGIGIPSMFGSLSHQAEPVRSLVGLGWWWHTQHDTIEHIDPQNLVRDTRIVLEVLRHLLTSKVLPLDYSAYAVSFLDECARLHAQLDGRFDIGPLETAASTLRKNADRLLSASVGASDDEADRINDTLMRVSRLLVPLNYTTGERFQHDPALPHSPWPSLEGLRELGRQCGQSADHAFYVVHARQTRNRVLSALLSANAAFETTIKEMQRTGRLEHQ